MNVADRLRFSPYAPVRYQHEFWWRYAVNAARAGWVAQDGRVASNLPDAILKQLVEPALKEGARQLKEEFPDPAQHGHLVGQLGAKLFEQRHWVPLVAQFIQCGRQVFDLTDEVVEMLEHTDFGDCTLEGWHPPYEAFFVRFGKRDAIRIPWEDDFEYLDGAFVAVTPYDDHGALRLKIGFSTCKKDGDGVMMPGYFLDFTSKEQALPVAVAVEHAIARRASAYEDQVGQSETTRAMNAHQRAEIRDGGDILKQASGLIVNVLFYLESLGQQRRQEPGRDAPTAYVVRWEQSNPKQREKLKSRLLAEGYTAVYLLGREFSQPRVDAHEGTRRTHWRRGHWRHQHHGPANSLVKRIWLKPQMIGSGTADDLPGHVYVVGNAAALDSRH